MRPAVLFARRDSIYKVLDCDVWDEERDTLKWPGGAPVVAHPPCRTWGRLSTFATKALPGEKQLALWAVRAVRINGGVLEHPATSRLFSATAMPGESIPPSGERDAWGGFRLTVEQWWFGHRAEKLTTLYVCGCEPSDLPEIPIKLGYAPCVVQTRIKNGEPGFRPHISKAEREHTPPRVRQMAPGGRSALQT